ncbi:hypothetical protein D2A34_26200 [Clostridium chromiireducens]|uniref:EfeO-type cupredoxin-like domain-containing protein n=1 Tax=Clostridium chromiireducens TaxID=225345 RepID=A0A399IGC2_9CLOT|nr:hypothetical protein [Clostridium chromiireducens]RII31860.1 hypothetical protein D2A34_26200 [Clostridium chromiireducens]
MSIKRHIIKVFDVTRVSKFLHFFGINPLMLTFRAISGLLRKRYRRQILVFSGVLVIVLGIIMGNRNFAPVNGGVSNASKLTQNLSGAEANASQSNATKATIENGVQIIKMTVDNNGYTLDANYIQKDMPVKLIIAGNQLNPCNNAIVVPSLNIQQSLKSGENLIEFTAKDEDIDFDCWMGMIRGVIKVIDDINTKNI